MYRMLPKNIETGQCVILIKFAYKSGKLTQQVLCSNVLKSATLWCS